MRRFVVLILAAVWLAPGVVLAQAPPRSELAAGVTFGFSSLRNCGLDADCARVSTGWAISPAYYLTERIAVVGKAAGSYASFDLTIPDVGDLDASSSSYSFGGGMRATSSRASGMTAAFVQTIVAFNHIDAAASALGIRAANSYSSVSLEPSVGVDIGMAERIALRLQGGYGFRLSGEAGSLLEPSSLGPEFGAGLVFGF